MYNILLYMTLHSPVLTIHEVYMYFYILSLTILSLYMLHTLDNFSSMVLYHFFIIYTLFDRWLIHFLESTIEMNHMSQGFLPFQILMLEQFGFTTKVSTHRQLLNIAKFFCENFNINILYVALYLSNIFHKVWHEDLICKLIQLGVHAGFKQSILSYVTDYNVCTCTNNILLKLYLILSAVIDCLVFNQSYTLMISHVHQRLLLLCMLTTRQFTIAHSSHTIYIKIMKITVTI